PYGIKGAIWYQGESNADRAMQYRELFPTMIQDWRARWGQGPFPFYFVQLANFMARKPEPSESQWAELREAQTMTLSLPNTGMALAIDIGEAGDIHPKNKREVGRRLALNALGRTYKQPVIYEGPTYSGMTVAGDTVRVTFKNGALETTDKAAPRSFQIAGEDKKWVWTDARIDGSTVVLRASGVAKPVAVRYGWADNPDVNLVNRAGLPAVPFRTDAP
ncbi:9-O-acetylesterase, partial [bacterium]